MTNEEIQKSTATKIAIGINLPGALIAIWMIAYPEPYHVALIIGMLFPLVYIIIVVSYKSLIRFNTSCFAFVACSMVLMIKAVLDFEILEYERLWISVTFLTMVMLLVLITLSSEFNLKAKAGRLNILSVSLFLFFYSFGIYTISNCLFDQSKDQLFKTTIASKQITKGTKSMTYHLYLNPWGINKEEDHVTVTSDQYAASDIGGSVNIYLKPGRFGTPWYSISIN